MNKSYFITLAIASLWFLTACENPTVLSVSQTALTFESGGGNQSVTLTANKMWTASSNQGWLKVSPSSGEGNASISIMCDGNQEYDTRTGIITLISEDISSTISVTQAEELGLIVSQNEFNLSNEAQIITVEVQSNVYYIVEIDASCTSWIKLESTKGLSSGIVKFAISRNDAYNSREGVITIRQTNGSLISLISVTQSQVDGLFVSIPEYALSNEKHTLVVEVKSNIEFEVTSDADWIKYVATKGLNTSQIILEIDSNETYDDRVGYVNIQQKNGTNGSLKRTITIKQDKNPGIILSQTEYYLSNDSHTIELEVKYNVELDVVIQYDCTDWISIVKSKGLSSSCYTIFIANNQSFSDREGSITFKQHDGELCETISIKQEQTDCIMLDNSLFEVSEEEQQLTVNVQSNIDYQVEVDDDCKSWLSFQETKYLSYSTLVIYVNNNDEGERTGRICLLGRNNYCKEIIVRQFEGGSVVFDDINFEKYCLDNYDNNHDGRITYSELRDIASLDISGKGIVSLKGIEAFTSLRSLSCSGNRLSTIDVSRNFQLKSINASSNFITCFLLGDNKLIEIIDCSENRLSSIDVRNCIALKELIVWGNDLDYLDVSANKNLVRLNCDDNRLRELNVRNCPRLSSLWCCSNHITYLYVNNNIELEELNCACNEITQLDVSNNGWLEYLMCGGNPLQTLDVSNNLYLNILDCQNIPNLVVWLDSTQVIKHFYYSDSTIIKYK